MLQGFCSISENWEHLNFFSAKLPVPQNAPLQLRNANLTTRQSSPVKVPKISPKAWKRYQEYENSNWVKSCSKSSSGTKECSFENSSQSLLETYNAVLKFSPKVLISTSDVINEFCFVPGIFISSKRSPGHLECSFDKPVECFLLQVQNLR